MALFTRLGDLGPYSETSSGEYFKQVNNTIKLMFFKKVIFSGNLVDGLEGSNNGDKHIRWGLI